MADVVKKIGSAGGGIRDYPTWALWIAAVPADITTAGGDNYRGEGYNDSEFVSNTTQLNIAGFTTSAAHQIIATAAAGQSFQDNASVRTNALRYNASNGVALRQTASYGGTLIGVNSNYVQVTRLQLKDEGTGNGSSTPLSGEGTPATNIIFKDCICEAHSRPVFNLYGSGCYAINISGFLRGSTGAGGDNGCHVRNGATAIGCTIVRDSGVSATGIGAMSLYSNSVLQSCAFFGFTTAASASNWDTTNSKNNATQLSSGLPGSGNQYSVTYNSTTPFTSAVIASLDLSAVASTSLAANGYKDGTNAPNDITGTARASSPTIGAWEISGGAAPAPRQGLIMGVGL